MVHLKKNILIKNKKKIKDVSKKKMYLKMYLGQKRSKSIYFFQIILSIFFIYEIL